MRIFRRAFWGDGAGTLTGFVMAMDSRRFLQGAASFFFISLPSSGRLYGMANYLFRCAQCYYIPDEGNVGSEIAGSLVLVWGRLSFSSSGRYIFSMYLKYIPLDRVSEISFRAHRTEIQRNKMVHRTSSVLSPSPCTFFI